jgi:uncharacterized BrkB/YihY/UPF0761 family membrane protein
MSNVRSFNRPDQNAADGSDRADPKSGMSFAGSSHDQGRGRRAVAPWQIPFRGWKDILVRTYHEINDDRLLAVAAGVVFYGLLALFPAITATIGLGSVSDALLRIGRWPALVAMMLLGLAVLYRYGPSRQSPQWRWLTVGSVLASVTWLAGSALLSFYLANYANYDATYGSLGAAIGLMMWMWMSTIVVLFGAELNSEIEHQTAMDSTGDGNKPLGARGAKVADTVGEAKN